MGNEVLIEVRAADQTGPVKEEIKASWQTFDKSFQPIALRAANPISAAFMAEVKSSIKTLSQQALEIPVDADTAPFLAQLESVLTELASTTRADIPLEVGDAQLFREQVTEQVAQLSESVHAVIDIEVDDTGLTDLQTKTLTAAESTTELVAAQQKLESALQSGGDEKIAKAREELTTANRNAQAATHDLEMAQAAEAATTDEVAGATDAAAFSMRSLNAAMGPLWMVMNVAQIAMMAFYGTSSSTASGVQDLATQIVGLGQATGASAASTLDNNQALSQMNDQLHAVGSSSAAFAQAATGGVGTMTQYVNGLTAAQQQLGAQTASYTASASAANRAGSEQADTNKTVTTTIKDLSDGLADGRIAAEGLSQATEDQVQEYRDYAAVIPQAQAELKLLVDEQKAEADQLAAVGFVMSSSQQAVSNYGTQLQQTVKDYQAATSGSTYLENAQDKATITAGQAATSWKTLQQAVVTAGQSYQQAAQGVASAEHSVETARQSVTSAIHSEEQAAAGVQSAMHAEQQAVLAVTSAQQSYTNAVYQEQQAQMAVTAARAAAQQQLVSLQLQTNDAAASVDSANVSLYKAKVAAAALGVTPGNAQQIAGEQITAANLAQVEAADALLQAENQLADAQNSSAVSQQSLNTARREGVDNNPAVLSAEHSLEQAQQGVASAAQGVANAQYAEQQSVLAVANAQWSQRQASIAVSNAEWSLRQASVAVHTAEVAEQTAAQNLTAARDQATRSTNVNTLAGAQNRQALIGIYDANVALYGPTQKATDVTIAEGKAAGFTSGQVNDVIGSVNGLNGLTAYFSLVGNPTLNAQQLGDAANALGLTNTAAGIAAVEATLPATHIGTRRLQATGGPGGGLTWVGEQGPELVDLPIGSEVIPSANSMQRVLMKEVIPPGHANGGPVSGTPGMMLAANFNLMGQTAANYTLGQFLHVLGGPAPKAPAATAHLDLGPFAAASAGFSGAVPGVRSSEAANRSLMFSIFASMFGWGSPAEQAATDYLMMRESGYNNMAQNPTSTAFGQFQFLNSTWASYGVPKTADPGQQDIAGGRYIAARYHDPIGAAMHERAYSWYGQGGISGSDGWIGVGEHGPELMRVPGGTTVMPAANRQAAVPASELTVRLEVGRGGDRAVAALIQGLVRTGALYLQVNGKQVTSK